MAEGSRVNVSSKKNVNVAYSVLKDEEFDSFLNPAVQSVESKARGTKKTFTNLVLVVCVNYFMIILNT